MASSRRSGAAWRAGRHLSGIALFGRAQSCQGGQSGRASEKPAGTAAALAQPPPLLARGVTTDWSECGTGTFAVCLSMCEHHPRAWLCQTTAWMAARTSTPPLPLHPPPNTHTHTFIRAHSHSLTHSPLIRPASCHCSQCDCLPAFLLLDLFYLHRVI